MSNFYSTGVNNTTSIPITNKCIVLDLDETLIHSSEKINDLINLNIMSDPDLLDVRERVYQIIMDDVVYRKGSGIKTVMWGIVRPYAKEFLKMCFKYFKVVIVWSAGKRKYVDAIVDFLFKDIQRPHVVYSYDECEKTPSELLVKPLRKLIDNEADLSKYMNLENSFMIDDRHTVYSGYKNDNPNNGIQIPPYKPEFTIKSLRKYDNNLKQLMEWFLEHETINSEDVRVLDKSNIFSTNYDSNLDVNTQLENFNIDIFFLDNYNKNNK